MFIGTICPYCGLNFRIRLAEARMPRHGQYANSDLSTEAECSNSLKLLKTGTSSSYYPLVERRYFYKTESPPD